MLAIYTGGESLLGLLRKDDMPAVNMLGLVVKDPFVPHVGLDSGLAATMVAEHFAGRGFRHLAFCTNFFYPSRFRKRQFAKAATDLGCEAFELNWSKARRKHSLLPEKRWEWLAQALAELPKPLAVLAQNDDTAVDVMHACMMSGLHVPEEVAIVGWDNDPLACEFSPIPLSSLDSDLEGIGYQGAKLLDHLMDGEPPPVEPVWLPPKGIVVRQSSNIHAVAHSNTAKALSYIREHSSDPSLSVGDVARAVGMSKTGLNSALPPMV